MSEKFEGEERKDKVSAFKLDLHLDEEFGEMGIEPLAEEPLPVPTEDAPLEEPVAEDPPTVQEPDVSDEVKTKKPKKANTGCLKIAIYAAVVLILSSLLAYFLITGVIDMMGIKKSEERKDVEIPLGATTTQIAEILKQNELIDQPFIFRLYSKFTKADGTYQPGMFTLIPNMGYQGIIEMLQESKPRDSVRITFREGLTVDEIAKILEKKGVCTVADFYLAVVKGNFDQYEFIRDIPTAEQGSQYAGRVYRLEGYLFPDTYDFYTGTSGETVINKMLQNFDTRVNASLRAAIKAKGMTLDQAIIFASMVEGEAAKPDDMFKVARVLYNRLENAAVYPKLQCDSTRDYITSLIPQVDDTAEFTNESYDTYKRVGLPVGAINNPGLQAIEATIHPADDPETMKCFFFATDYKTEITYFTKTLKEHETICRRYKIGMYK